MPAMATNRLDEVYHTSWRLKGAPSDMRNHTPRED